MDILIISLESAKQRRETIRHQFNKLGIAFELFPAVTPDNAAAYFRSVKKWIFQMEVGRQATPAEIACFASHKALWQRCVESDQPIVIMEDDVLLAPGFSTAIALTEEVIDSYGFIRLEELEEGWHWWKCGEPATITQHGDYTLLYQTTPSLRGSAYAISPLAARRFLRASQAMNCPSDHFVRRNWIHKQPLFALSPAPVKLSDHADNSTISDRKDIDPSAPVGRIRKMYKNLSRWQQKRFNRRQMVKLAQKTS